MRIAHISAGAAGMFCGTCMHNNTLAKALIRRGLDVALIPTYTPLRTDEESVAIDQVFFGAINVYLQQKIPLFRYTPRFLDKFLDRPKLLNWVSRFSGSTNASALASMIVSMLEGEEGEQKKELERLVVWLRDDFKPDLVHLSLSMFLGFAHRLKEELQVPIVCELQGEDIFFEELHGPLYPRIRELLEHHARYIDTFIVPCTYYIELMSTLYGFPKEKMRVVPLGIDSHDLHPPRVPKAADQPVTIGFFARQCPEKGLHHLVEAFRMVAEDVGKERVRLAIAGYVQSRDEAFVAEQKDKLEAWGLADRVEYHGEVDRDGKVDFLASCDIFSVPTVYREPKGLYLFEAMASALPVVQPAHGAFPEILEETGGGVLVEPESPRGLADALGRLVLNAEERHQLGACGREAVLRGRTDDAMAAAVHAVYNALLEPAVA